MNNLTLSQRLQEEDEAFQTYENSWKSLECLSDKKYMSWRILAWCKKQRDLFDDFEMAEPTATAELDNWVNIENHEAKWNDRVTTWRQRFNEFH